MASDAKPMPEPRSLTRRPIFFVVVLVKEVGFRELDGGSDEVGLGSKKLGWMSPLYIRLLLLVERVN
jgi:hypothetical protein